MPCASRFTYPKILCGAMMTMNSKPYTVKSHRLRVRCSSCLYPNCSTDPFSSAIVTSTNVDSTLAARNKRAGTSARGPLSPGGLPSGNAGARPLASLIQNGPPSRVRPSPLASPVFPVRKTGDIFFPSFIGRRKSNHGRRATNGFSSRNSYNSGLSARLGTEMRSTISTGQGWQP